LSDYGDFNLNYRKRLSCCETCILFVLSIMRVSSQSLFSSAMTIGLASALVVVATAIILLTPNTAIVNAQQFTNQPSEVTQNGTTTAAAMTSFESRNDSFRVQVPEGWVIDDVNNTGSTMTAELTQGYGILAELCPEEEEGGQLQQQEALSNVSNSSSNSNSNSTSICQQQQAQDEIIHIVRYPNLSARLQLALGVNNTNTTTDNILSYHLQKLQEVGYRSIEIVNSTETTVNVTNTQTNQTIQTVPAKFVEMTYVTNLAPNEIREGYFISTATDATDPDPGVTKGYTVFYEGNSTAANVTSIAQTTTTSDNLLPPLAAPVRQAFDSFELLAAEEVAETGGGGPTISDSDDSGGGNTTDDSSSDSGGGGGGGPTINDNDSGGGTTTDDSSSDSGGGTTTDDDNGSGGGGGGPTINDPDDSGGTTDDGDTGGGGTTDDNDNDDSGEGPTNPLTAEIISNGTQGVAPATFEFQANVTGGREPYTINWDFGDDEDSVESDDEQDVVHAFDEAGTYNVTLTITDSTGRTASNNILITVVQPPALTSAEIISSGTEGVAPATFGFEADVVGGTEPYTYSWDFDDGSEGNDEQTVEHTFDLGGTYNVDLTVTDSRGQSASDSVEITIEEPSPPPAAEEQEQEEQQEQAAETVCDSSYPDLCIPPPPPDLDCGNDGIPENFQVLPPDPHGFDSDNDGIGCDSESNDAIVEPESSNNDSGTTVGRTSSDDDDD
jgi:PKD repeat protein